MTTTIDPAEDVTDDASSAGSALRPALAIALATALFLAAAAGVVFVFVHKTLPTPEPAPIAQAAPAPSATPTPEEQFLGAWHQVAPGVAARRSDNTWTRIAIGTCKLIGIPGATPDALSRVLGSNPDLMSVAEATQFLGVAQTKLCPEKTYVAGPTLVLPNAPTPSLPDFGELSVPRTPSGGSGWIPTHQPAPPSVHVPSIPGAGSGGSSSGSSSSGGGHSPSPPSIVKLPSSPIHTEG